MTVKELILILEKFPEDHDVMVEALDSGEPYAISGVTSDNYYKRAVEDDGETKNQWSEWAYSTATIELQI